MKYTQEEYQRANQVDLVSFLRARGYHLIRDGRLSYRMKEHDSFVIKNNYWYWNSRGLKGYPVEFLTKVEGYTLPEAVNLLANGEIPISSYNEKPAIKTFKLPNPNNNHKKVFHYLNQIRGVDPEIIATLIKEGKIYESKQYHNCVFVGYDATNNARYATLRGIYDKSFKQDVLGSDKSCPFFMTGKSDTVLLFESAIDALSHATLTKMNGDDWQKDYRVSLGGVSNLGISDRAVIGFLKQHHHIRKLCFCLDSDEAARNALPKLCEKYDCLGFEVYTQTPQFKDFNEDLLNTIPTIEDSFEHEL